MSISPDPLFVCIHCDATFSTHKEQRQHSRSHQFSVCIRSGVETTFIYADEHGSFVCVCGQVFTLPQALQRHARDGCYLLGDATCAVEYSDNLDDLVSTQLLKRFRLAINIRHACVICIECAIVLADVKEHLLRKKMYTNKKELQQILEAIDSLLEPYMNGK